MFMCYRIGPICNIPLAKIFFVVCCVAPETWPQTKEPTNPKGDVTHNTAAYHLQGIQPKYPWFKGH